MNKDLVLIVMLVFLQGISFGFQIYLIPLLLRQRGFDVWKITLLNMLNLPWLLKTAVTSILHNAQPKLYVFVSILLSALCFIMMDWCLDNQALFALSLVLLTCNFAAVVMDTMVDRMCINYVSAARVGSLSSARVVVYKIGMLTPNLILAFTSTVQTFNRLSSIAFLCTAIMYYLLMRHYDSKTAHHTNELVSNANKFRTIKENTGKCLRVLKTTEGSIALLLFCIFHKTGESGFLKILPISLLDQGLQLRNISLINGLLGAFISMLGSVLGGFYARDQMRRAFFIAILIRGLCMLFQLIYVSTTMNLALYAVSEIIFQLAIGFITSLTYTRIMTFSLKIPEEQRAICYSLLSSIIPFGKIMTSSLSGILSDVFGSTQFLGFCCVVELFLLSLVYAKRL